MNMEASDRTDLLVCALFCFVVVVAFAILAVCQ